MVMFHMDVSGSFSNRSRTGTELLGIRTLEAANRFLREHYIAEFNRRFQVPARERGSAFVRRSSRDPDLIFALQYQRTVNRDNTVSIQNLHLQIEPVRAPPRSEIAGSSTRPCFPSPRSESGTGRANRQGHVGRR
jgi:hypothetical protein